MISRRLENEGGVIEQIGQSLNGAIKIRGRGVDKEKMMKRLRNKLPAPDERVAQNQSRIVPDKIVPERRRVERQDDEGEK